MSKILCLMVVLSLLIVGCGEEKKEVKSHMSLRDLMSKVEEPVSKDVEEKRNKKVTKLALGMKDSDWTPESANSFLKSLYNGNVVMVKEAGGDKYYHIFNGKKTMTLMDFDVEKEDPNIKVLEGKSPEALFYLYGLSHPTFILKYNTLWFTTGVDKWHIENTFKIRCVHIDTFNRYKGDLRGEFDESEAFGANLSFLSAYVL